MRIIVTQECRIGNLIHYNTKFFDDSVPIECILASFDNPGEGVFTFKELCDK